jgi:hypothetical protein
MKSPTRISIHEEPGMITNISQDEINADILNEMGEFKSFHLTETGHTELNEDLLQYIHTIAIALESKVIRK